MHLGPSWAKAGRKVATVFEDPSIEPNSIQIYRTHTRELIIKGTGFNKLSPPVIDFEPPLDFAGVYVQVSYAILLLHVGCFVRMFLIKGLRGVECHATQRICRKEPRNPLRVMNLHAAGRYAGGIGLRSWGATV